MYEYELVHIDTTNRATISESSRRVIELGRAGYTVAANGPSWVIFARFAS